MFRDNLTSIIDEASAPGNCAKGQLYVVAVTAHVNFPRLLQRLHRMMIHWLFSHAATVDSNLFLILLLINSTAFPFPIWIPSIWSTQHFGTITDSSIGRRKRSLSSVPFLFAQTRPITWRSNHNVACLAFELIVWPPGKVGINYIINPVEDIVNLINGLFSLQYMGPP